MVSSMLIRSSASTGQFGARRHLRSTSPPPTPHPLPKPTLFLMQRKLPRHAGSPRSQKSCSSHDLACCQVSPPEWDSSAVAFLPETSLRRDQKLSEAFLS